MLGTVGLTLAGVNGPVFGRKKKTCAPQAVGTCTSGAERGGAGEQGWERTGCC